MGGGNEQSITEPWNKLKWTSTYTVIGIPERIRRQQIFEEIMTEIFQI